MDKFAYKKRPCQVVLLVKLFEVSDRLESFAKSHFVCKERRTIAMPIEEHPCNTIPLCERENSNS